MPANTVLTKPWATFGNWSIAAGTVRDRAVAPYPTEFQQNLNTETAQVEARSKVLTVAIVAALIWAGFAFYDMKGG